MLLWIEMAATEKKEKNIEEEEEKSSRIDEPAKSDEKSLTYYSLHSDGDPKRKWVTDIKEIFRPDQLRQRLEGSKKRGPTVDMNNMYFMGDRSTVEGTPSE